MLKVLEKLLEMCVSVNSNNRVFSQSEDVHGAKHVRAHK